MAAFADPVGKTQRATIAKLAQLMFEDGDSFAMNIYPYFALKNKPLGQADPSLDYALGNTPHTALDGRTYTSLLHAMHAAAEAALLKLDSRYTPDRLPVYIGETGWPTADIGLAAAATTANAHVYTTNAVAFAASSKVTVYLFGAFDEQRKATDSGAGSQTSNVEKHWGMMTEAGTPKYTIAALAALAIAHPHVQSAYATAAMPLAYCQDVDECSATVTETLGGTVVRVPINPCPNHAVCTNTLGSFTCACKAGYVNLRGM